MFSDGAIIIKILVCGSGSIGVRHIRNLRLLGCKVVVWRFHDQVELEFRQDPGVAFAMDLDEAMKSSDAVIIATSTDTHMEIAALVVKHGKHFFIEKPISHNLEAIDDINRQILQKKLVVEVGCQLRMHPGLRKLSRYLKENDLGPLYTFQAIVGQRLEYWRPGTDYTKCYSADGQRGGGALFDLIHELDLLLWLTGPVKEVFAELSQVSDQAINADDLSNLILVMDSGAVGQLQQDMLSPVYRRRLELVFQKVVLCWDYVSGTLRLFSAQGETLLYEIPYEFDRNNMFIDHMKHFITQVKNGVPNPACSFDSGINALKLALAARSSSVNGRKVLVG